MGWFRKQTKLNPNMSDVDNPNHVSSEPVSNNRNFAREFDLNIEKILENWEVHHALREIIANALDEQILTNTANIEIKKENDAWHIIDYGRGLSYHHLTQNESEEKLKHNQLIGRFGVGLKDALATLYRHGIKVTIASKHGIITLTQSSKTDFDDIITLHAKILPPIRPDMVGTDFCLEGCPDTAICLAKQMFLKFANETIIGTSRYGQVIKKQSDSAFIYINGVKVAEEVNFLFSYNITSLTQQLKKALNRERTNVGRAAYSDRIKSILLDCSDELVINELVSDLQQFSSGHRHDELAWNDVALHASIKMNEKHANAAFVTTKDFESRPSIIDEMQREGFTPVIVPETLITKIKDYNRNVDDEDVVNTTDQYIDYMQQTFEPQIVFPEDLTDEELSVYMKMDDILSLIGGIPCNVKQINIVDSLYQGDIRMNVVGLWTPNDNTIRIHRSQLGSLQIFAQTLLHECAHAISGASDVDRDFESELTNIIGRVVDCYFMTKK